MTQDAPPSGEGGDADRRLFLTRLASLATAAGVADTAAGTAQSADAPPAAPAAGAAPAAAAANSQDAAYQLFGQDEAAFVEALVNVMCPADALTPNGVDCGIATYIDRQLAGAFGQGAKRYMQAPFKPAKPELGYQLPLTPAQYFKAGIEATNQHCKQHYGKSFDQLAAADADALLQRLADGQLDDERLALSRWFHELAYPLFVQGCFADPIYGGNRNKVFWKMIGYPGLPAVYARDIVDYRGKPHPAARDPKSIADFS
jgi:gluconate 2-dehydrogenase gamma chain